MRQVLTGLGREGALIVAFFAPQSVGPGQVGAGEQVSRVEFQRGAIRFDGVFECTLVVLADPTSVGGPGLGARARKLTITKIGLQADVMVGVDV